MAISSRHPSPEAHPEGSGAAIPSGRRRLPAGLHVSERAPSSGWAGYEGPIVVLVHGTFDHGRSFARTTRRLPEWAVVTYDRRGYRSSRRAGLVDRLEAHVEDLGAIAAAYSPLGPLSAVGHSLGALIVLAAARRDPAHFASIGAYEPSLPWLGFHPTRPDLGNLDPDLEAERFYRRMVGDGAWERLSDETRRERLADGPALVADITGFATVTPFDVVGLAVPALIGSGGTASFEHHLRTAEWLSEHLPFARRHWIPDAGHGAHVSHPDAFARFVREAVELGRKGAAP